MIDLKQLSERDFLAMPLVYDGESKEVRYAGSGKAVIRLKPTIYSFTQNRYGRLEGSDLLRLQASRLLIEWLKGQGIDHSFSDFSDRWILSDFIMLPQVAGTAPSFRPDDLDDPEIGKLKVAPPIEVIVKCHHVGTPKHRYYGMSEHAVRASHRRFPGQPIREEAAYPEVFVRFDWRNPMTSPAGARLADEVLPEAMADWFIDTARARETALRAFRLLSAFLETKGIVCLDLCFFISEDGGTIFSEISQDCGRFRHIEAGPVDKDVWRSGNSGSTVLEKWGAFLHLLQA